MNTTSTSNLSHLSNGHTITVPASMIQRQFWLLNQLDKGGSVYNIPLVYKLTGPLNTHALKDSITEIAYRHDILRTNFSIKDGELYQLIHQKQSIPFNMKDVSGIEPNQRQTEMTLMIEKEILGPFNLEKSPLLRVLLIKLDDAEYVLSIVMHHIVTDLHSKSVFCNELDNLYNNKVTNKPFIPSEQVHHYKEYSLRQLKWLETEASEKMTLFWKHELQNQSDVINLPSDYPRPSGITYSGKCEEFFLSQELSEQLKKFSRKNTVDIFVTLLASYLVLLYRHTNQKQIVIGVPLSNRRHEDDKDTLGCFVNILPLAFDLSDVAHFLDVVKQIRMKMLKAHRHQEVPFESIINLIKPNRDPSYNPLFQVGFTAEPYTPLNLESIDASPLRVYNQGAQLDLFLNIKNLDKRISGYFEYNTDLFSDSKIKRLREHYCNILEAVLADTDAPIATLPLLAESEKEQLIHQFNDTAEPFPNNCLHQLFEKQVLNAPQSIAVTCGKENITYLGLNNRANQLSHFLRSKGAGRETLIGIYIDRSIEMMIALYGILKSGGAYVPLDTEFPQNRIGQMLEDANPMFIITKEDLAPDLPENNAQLVYIDREWEEISKFPIENIENIATPENLAYVIFTSGSTGRPKGVQVPQQAVVNFLCSMQKKPGITDKDILLAVTTLSFDISVLELFLPLTIGAQIVIADTETAKNGQALFSLMKHSGTTIIQATPTTFHLLITAGWDTRLNVKVLCGGELFPHELAQQLTKLAQVVWNMYGPTETTIWSTIYKITEGQPVFVGCPIDNTQVYIVNDQCKLAPFGVAGELLIGGTGVTRGYLDRPELNNQQFIPDCFNPQSEYPLYRTGDLACYQEDGQIKILGRIDHQIKIRGFRIELGEIETAIVSHPQVEQGVVKTHDFGGGDIRLIAYATLRDGKDDNVQFRSYLQDLLPEYMIPSLFTILDEMPLTLNNKIDRKALPEPDRSRQLDTRELAKPENDLEQFIAKQWSEVLKLDQIGIDETFFDLGGNSLLSIYLIDQLEKSLNVKIPVVKFYQFPTVRHLASYLKSEKDPEKQSTANDRARLRKSAMTKFKKRAGKQAS